MYIYKSSLLDIFPFPQNLCIGYEKKHGTYCMKTVISITNINVVLTYSEMALGQITKALSFMLTEK